MIYSGEINYEKKYKEALEKARKTLEKSSAKDVAKLVVEYFFPELKESEDEKIRKGIIELVKQSSEILDKKNQEQMLDWLEKQGVKTSKWTEADKTIMEDIIGYYQSERDITTDEEYIMDLDKYLRLLQRVIKTMEEQQ